jgi:uncharacterized protein YndB with AHSA1/START domain
MNAPAAAPELTIRRNFDAPRALVYRMWTEQEHLAKWCCPKGFTIPFSQGDIVPGGAFRTCMRAPDGDEHWLSGIYRTLEPPHRIVFTHGWEDGAGNRPHETTVTITLEEDGPERTRLTLHQAFFTSTSSRDGHEIGWNETLDNLREHLST